jgi:hypothetical protein
LHYHLSQSAIQMLDEIWRNVLPDGSARLHGLDGTQDCVKHLAFPFSFLPDRIREEGSNSFALGGKWAPISSSSHALEFPNNRVGKTLLQTNTDFRSERRPSVEHYGPTSRSRS